MGDSRRNVEFAKFIRRQFPKAESVLVVADGKGELANELAKKYKKVRVIEAKPRQTKKRKRVRYHKGWFSYTDEVEEDIIVGMHPDEATADIIKAAKNNNKKFAVVPCCLKGLEAHGVNGFNEWVKKLERIAGTCRMTRLPIYGKNVVIWN